MGACWRVRVAEQNLGGGGLTASGSTAMDFWVTVWFYQTSSQCLRRWRWDFVPANPALSASRTIASNVRPLESTSASSGTNMVKDTGKRFFLPP